MTGPTKTDAPKIGAAVLLLPVTDIDPAADSRIGLFHAEKAEGLAARMLVDGQNDPIKVRRNGNRAKLPWTLVAGLHRLEACRINGLPVRAIEVGGDADTLRAIQASENIDRRELEPLERAMFVAAVADAAKARLRALNNGKSQQQVAAEIGASERSGKMLERSDERADKVQFTAIEKADAEGDSATELLQAAYRWSEATAAACGMSVDKLKRSLRIFRIIVEPNRDLVDALKDHPVAQNSSALLAICAQGNNPANVRALVTWLIANPAAKTADEALMALSLMPSRGGTTAPATGDTKYLNGLQSNLQRLSLGGQRRAAEVIAQSIAPTALFAVRDAIAARIAAIEADTETPAQSGDAA